MIIFYDGTCPLCNRAVRFILAADKKEQFYFAPLEGETAANKLKKIYNTLVLYKDPEHILTEGKAVLRICWLIGGKYALIGWLSFLPAFLFNLIYRVIAKYRFRLFSKKASIEKTDRFLP